MIPSGAEPLDPAILAVARGRGLDLMASLFAKGLTADRLPHLAAVRALQPLLPTADRHDPDQAAAEHHRVLGTQVFAAHAAFVHPEGLVGGDTAGAARQFWARIHWTPPPDQEPDSAPTLLAGLAWLMGAEAQAHRDGTAQGVHSVQAAQAELLGTHVLPWWPALVQALGQVDAPLYDGLAQLSMDLLTRLAAQRPAHRAPAQLPEQPPLLDDPKTGLARICRLLTTPARAGALLTDHRIRALGQQLGLPTGFGKRWQRLENLLHTAARQGQQLAALDTLADEFAAIQATYGAHEAPVLAPYLAPWKVQAAASQALLRQMGARARTPSETTQ